MIIDNSAFTTYMFCPKKYMERYEYVLPALSGGSSDGAQSNELESPSSLAGTPVENPVGLELIARSREGLDFGTRFHQLYENHSRELLGQPEKQFPEWPDRSLEDEVQSTWAAYLAHYPVEPLSVLSAERTETVPIPGTTHSLIVKLDRAVRFADGTIGPMDLKTESTPGYNTRESWAGRTQASLYLWALQQLMPSERVSRLVVDVVTRGNTKRSPTFSRLDDIGRPPEALADAIRNVTDVCDSIERHRREGWWPSNMNVCKDGWKVCDYYGIHVYGKTDANLRLYRPATPYLDV